MKPLAALLRGNRLLVAGAVAFTAVALAWVIYWLLAPYTTVFAVDLTVYRDGGLIVRGIAPYYDPHAASPLYDWGGYSDVALKFTYTPFAAIAFALASFLPATALIAVSVAASVAALLAALWWALGALGVAGRGNRAGLTLLCAAAVFWTQPVLRNLNLGQVNLILMAMIMWDLCQPVKGRSGKYRWWRGFATGVAAGIKLVPLVFIPYQLATRRFREAAMTVAGFAVTIVVGFAVLPSDSATWWLHGIFLQGDRAGFLGWAGNQSLRGLITRLAGSIAAGTVPWVIAAAIVLALGIWVATVLSRAGHEVPALLVIALTGLLASPISWDHHWVWIAPAFATAVVYARRLWDGARSRAWWLIGLTAGLLLVFGGWPDALWESARNLGRFSLGFLWAPPNTDPVLYVKYGDQPWFVEYHWHGLWLLTGNAYVLAGLVMFAVMGGVAAGAWRQSRAGGEVAGPGLGSPIAQSTR